MTQPQGRSWSWNRCCTTTMMDDEGTELELEQETARRGAHEGEAVCVDDQPSPSAVSMTYHNSVLVSELQNLSPFQLCA